ncbi:ABC transporter ATP-binding protein [uncultured Arthrobacter sp.]|uniref:ABC transporter ATP-binding protein n=1 Tax=uncultured Arthrobacter sp. TaxID=114050 RepID=UPI002632D228|nr:ABC transporter ATP-binding protein [uncultured Arthrobacter sp.]
METTTFNPSSRTDAARRPDAPIRVENLSKIYRQKSGVLHAVDNLNLSVRAGETYALLGPNGAGKSTTIEILEGHRKPTSGKVTVLETAPYKAHPSFRARIGIVLQEATDSGELRVAEALHALASYYPNPRPVDELISAVGLEGKESQRISTLSGGQRRRVDVALGLVGNPELLFLDEPTTGFDPDARRTFWELIRSLRADGTTIVLTTHYLDEAEQLADRLGVITHGQLVAEGTPGTLGGAALRTPRVSWADNAGHHEESTDRPAELVNRLSAGGTEEPLHLQVRVPSLEDIYLELLRQHDLNGEEAS